MAGIDERVETLKDVARHADAYRTAAARLQMFDEVCAAALAIVRSKKQYPLIYRTVTMAIVFGKKTASGPAETKNAFVDEYALHVKRLSNGLVKKMDDDFINGVTL